MGKHNSCAKALGIVSGIASAGNTPGDEADQDGVSKTTIASTVTKELRNRSYWEVDIGQIYLRLLILDRIFEALYNMKQSSKSLQSAS